MPRRRIVTTRAREDQRGFTLLEVLVVMLVLGILAAIALPMFLGQQDKGQDAEAKSNARNLVSQVVSCFAPSEDYSQCDTQAELGGNLGIPYGAGPGEAAVTDSGQNSFTITAVSKATTGGTNNTFSIVRASTGVTSRACTAGPGLNGGGCKNGTW